MRKSFFNTLPAIAIIFWILLFFAIPLSAGKIPIPADSLLGLYHPWRDVSFDNYNPEKFPVKNALITDPINQTFPWRFLTITAIKEGQFPLWNPYSFSGQPLLANIQSAPFQVFNLLFFILPFRAAWGSQIIIPSILTGVFMYLFLRSIKLSKNSSVFGSFILPFTGFFMAWLTWGTIVITAMWLPLILFSINKIFEKLSARWFLLLVFSISQTIFSGHWQTAFYVIFASFLYLCFVYIKFKKVNLLLSLAGIILGIILASPQILPSIEFINLSARSLDQDYYAGRTDWFLPLSNAIQLLAPDFFGNPTTYNYWGIWNYAEFVSYIGIIPLSFAIIALFNKFKQKTYFTLLILLSLIFGLENPISKIPYVFNLAFFSSLQPSRIIFLFIFSMVVLTSFGLDYFLKVKFNRKFYTSSIIIIIILLILFSTTIDERNQLYNLAIYDIDPASVARRNLIFPIIISFISLIIISLKKFRIQNRILIIIIFLLTTGELFRFGYKFTPFSKISLVFPQTSAISYLENQEKPFRIMTTDRRIFHPNTPSAFKIESVDGYDPLYLKSYGQLVSVWQSQNPKAAISSFNRIVTPQKLDSPIINLLNVKYVLTFDEIASPNFAKVYEEGITKIYENKNVIPRAFFANEVIKVNSQEAEFEKLLDPQINLSKIATSREFDFKMDQSKSQVQFKYYNDQSLGLLTETERSAPLVVSNMNYPGWISLIDGHETQIKTADFMFQSVMVPPGEHFVEFKFKPKSFYNGVYLALIGIALSAGCSLYLWRKKYR